jgi:hypothetical protein
MNPGKSAIRRRFVPVTFHPLIAWRRPTAAAARRHENIVLSLGGANPYVSKAFPAALSTKGRESLSAIMPRS